MVEHQFVCLWTTFNRRKMGKTVTHQIRPLLHHLYSPHHNITRHLQIVEQTSHHPSSRPFKTQRKRYIWYNPVFASNHSQQSKLITIARDLDPFDLECIIIIIPRKKNHVLQRSDHIRFAIHMFVANNMPCLPRIIIVGRSRIRTWCWTNLGGI